MAFTDDPTILALYASAGAVLFAALALSAFFRYLKPPMVDQDYQKCQGGWHESYLNDCEKGLLKIPQQPVNTYSNLAYLAAGVFMAVRLNTSPSDVFSGTMLYLCVGSSFYHALSTGWAGMLDVTAIYAVYSAVATYAAAALFGLEGPPAALAMFVVAGVVTYVLSPRFRRNMNVIIGIFLGIAYALVVLKMALSAHWRPGWFVAGSFGTFALAFLIWHLDKKKVFPLPGWGHGVWHVLTAAASALIFYAIHLTTANPPAVVR